MSTTSFEAFPPSDAPLRQVRILLAGNYGRIRDQVQHVLQRRWHVETVIDGASALAVAMEKPPDLVMAEEKMSKLDGLGLLRALRDDPKTCDIQVILLGSRSGKEANLHLLEAGADEVVAKPYNSRELEAKVTSRLEVARHRRTQASRETALIASANEARRKAAAVLESIDEGYYTLDADFRFTYINAGSKRMVPQLAEAEGKSVFDVFPERRGSEYEANMKRCVRDKTPVSFDVFAPAQGRWFRKRYYPMPDGGLANFWFDVTEQKVVQDLLASEQQMLALVTEHAQVGLLLIDQDHRYVYANAAHAAMVGREVKDVVGRSVAEIHPVAYEREIKPLFERAFAGERITYEMKMPATDKRPARILASTMERHVGQLGKTYVVVAIMDVTERKDGKSRRKSTGGA